MKDEKQMDALKKIEEIENKKNWADDSYEQGGKFNRKGFLLFGSVTSAAMLCVGYSEACLYGTDSLIADVPSRNIPDEQKKFLDERLILMFDNFMQYKYDSSNSNYNNRYIPAVIEVEDIDGQVISIGGGMPVWEGGRLHTDPAELAQFGINVLCGSVNKDYQIVCFRIRNGPGVLLADSLGNISLVWAPTPGEFDLWWNFGSDFYNFIKTLPLVNKLDRHKVFRIKSKCYPIVREIDGEMNLFIPVPVIYGAVGEKFGTFIPGNNKMAQSEKSKTLIKSKMKFPRKRSDYSSNWKPDLQFVRALKK